MLLLTFSFFRRISLVYPFLVLFCACGPKTPDERPIQSKPETVFSADLETLLQSYIKDSEAAEAPVDPKFRTELVQLTWDENLGMEGGRAVLGHCERLNEGYPDAAQRFRTVHIRKPGSDGKVDGITFDATTLKMIVYHELGHCLHDFHGHLPEASHQLMSSALPQSGSQSLGDLLARHFALMKAH